MKVRHPQYTILSVRSAGRVVLLIATLALLAACATGIRTPGPVQSNVQAASPGSEQSHWWFVRFRLAREADAEVNSYLDGLIADQLLAQVIAQHREQISLWRFHRRWPRDSTGHQFSFIFYAPRTLADVVNGQIERDPLLQRLRMDGHLVEFRTHEADPERSADVAATSDLSWPVEIQREWPQFIMGASRMWLGLVHSEAQKHAGLDLYERYQAVETGLDALWFKHGNHAFFHHLSALFGYQPLRVIRRDIMTF